MRRSINVYYHKHTNIIPQYSNIEIADIQNIVNYSIDFINCECLNFLDIKSAQQTLQILITKLKKYGSLLLSIKNIKPVSKLYADNSLDDTSLMSYLDGIQCVLSLDAIKALIDQQQDIKISKVQYDNINYLVNISIERIQL